MINFEFIDLDVSLDQKKVLKWVSETITNENKTPGVVTIVLGSDDWLLEKNIEFLNHDFYTDIITFDYCENEVVSGDLLISVDRVNENAIENNVSRETELNRVIIHGILHLIGYDDKTPKDSQLMRKKEDYYLSLL